MRGAVGGGMNEMMKRSGTTLMVRVSYSALAGIAYRLGGSWDPIGNVWEFHVRHEQAIIAALA